MIPENAVAETIQRLRNENLGMTAHINKNLELIEQLEPLAEWSEPVEQEPVPLMGE
jgi:hypothetical protein